MQVKSKPGIVFFALYRHHRRYFNKLKEALAGEYNPSVLMTYRFFLPLRTPEGMSGEEKERIIRYQFLRGELRYRRLFRFKVFRRLYKVVLGWAAGVFFANFRRYLAQENIAGIAVWNGCNLPLAAAVAAARRCGIKTVFFENGPLPNTTAVDFIGINYQNSFPRDPSFFHRVTIEEKKTGFLQKPELIARSFRKGKRLSSSVSLPDKYIFIPFQTYNDTQILLYSPWIKNMPTLVSAMIEARREAGEEDLWLVFKEHPSCRIDYSHLKQEFDKEKVLFATTNSTQDLIAQSLGVVTINSSVGVESLLLEKKVITLGEAFYNIPGLVLYAPDFSALTGCIKKLDSWSYDEDLRQKFLYYLRHYYLVEGKAGSPDENHLQEVKSRISKYLQGADA